MLVTKGSDAQPAKPEELANLNIQSRTAIVGASPIIVGDHRLDIKLITPPMENTLNEDKWYVLDQRIQSRLYQTYLPAPSSKEDPLALAKIVARGMESRRHMIKRTIEKKIIAETIRRNPTLTDKDPKLRFYPARIELSFDPAMVQFLIDMRNHGDISRDTYLNEVDFNQADEALLREREKKHYDKVFTPVNVPFSGNGTDPRDGGRSGGGNRNGGGAGKPGDGSGKPPRRGVPNEDEE